MTCCAVKLVALFLSQGKDLLKQHNFPFDLSDRRRVTKKLYRLIEIIFAGSRRTEFIAFALIFALNFCFFSLSCSNVVISQVVCLFVLLFIPIDIYVRLYNLIAY